MVMSVSIRLLKGSRLRSALPATRAASVLASSSSSSSSQAISGSHSARALSSSSSSSGFSLSPVQWWQNRQQAKESEKYRERVQEMARKPAWTLNNMKTEIDEVVGSWTAKVPGLNNVKEMEVSKKIHKAIVGTISIVGESATIDRLEDMSRLEKLKAAAAGGTTVEEINSMIQQFSTTSIMHKILRNRLESGRPLPETIEASQAILQSEGRSFLTSSQKQKLAKQAQRSTQQKMRGR